MRYGLRDIFAHSPLLGHSLLIAFAIAIVAYLVWHHRNYGGG